MCKSLGILHSFHYNLIADSNYQSVLDLEPNTKGEEQTNMNSRSPELSGRHSNVGSPTEITTP